MSAMQTPIQRDAARDSSPDIDIQKAEAELERHRISAHKEVDIHRSMSIIPGYCDQKKIVLPVSIPEIDPTLTQSSQHFENVFRKYFLNKKDWGKPETFKKHCFGSVRF